MTVWCIRLYCSNYRKHFSVLKGVYNLLSLGVAKAWSTENLFKTWVYCCTSCVFFMFCITSALTSSQQLYHMSGCRDRVLLIAAGIIRTPWEHCISPKGKFHYILPFSPGSWEETPLLATGLLQQGTVLLAGVLLVVGLC